MNIVDCTWDRHGEVVTKIINQAILETTALYEDDVRSAELMKQWFDLKAHGQWPIIGMENDQGQLMGFASYGPFRPQQGFKHSVEHSVYVQPQYQRRGVGQRLMQLLEQRAVAQGMHVMVAMIDSQNQESLGLHERCGFSRSGVIQQAGFKFGRWLDCVVVQKILTTTAPLTGTR